MNKIKEYRKKLQLSQAQLADAVGTSQSQIRRLESGERKLTKEWAERIAPLLEVRPEHLVFPHLNLSSPESIEQEFYTLLSKASKKKKHIILQLMKTILAEEE